eukprot:m.620598 g.620598  ORF g.620598 m.620598 type:complete len:58 (-) comp22537_c0_seq2:301-474(-)
MSLNINSDTIIGFIIGETANVLHYSLRVPYCVHVNIFVLSHFRTPQEQDQNGGSSNK